MSFRRANFTIEGAPVYLATCLGCGADYGDLHTDGEVEIDDCIYDYSLCLKCTERLSRADIERLVLRDAGQGSDA